MKIQKGHVFSYSFIVNKYFKTVQLDFEMFYYYMNIYSIFFNYPLTWKEINLSFCLYQNLFRIWSIVLPYIICVRVATYIASVQFYSSYLICNMIKAYIEFLYPCCNNTWYDFFYIILVLQCLHINHPLQLKT